MSVYKPKGSPFYHYDFQRGGHRFYGSTSTASRREAEAIERVEKAKAEAENHTRKRTDPTTIEAAFDRFWLEKGQHDAKSETTTQRMEKLQIGLTTLLQERNRRAILGEIDTEVIAAYVSRRRGTKSRAGRLLSNASVNRELQVLRRILRRAARVWRMPILLPAWEELFLPEADERVVDLSRDMEAKILAKLRPDFIPAAEFLIMSGLRAGNALPLHPSCVDFEQRLITVQQKSRKPGGKTHVIPITTRMMVLLANAIGHDENAVFTYVAKRERAGRVRGQRYPLTPETFYNAFKAAAAAVGRPELRPHDLRHVAGTRTLRASGGNLRAAQRHLGHARIATTTKYAHYLLDELRADMEAAHSPEQSPERETAAGDKPMKERKKRPSPKRS